MDRTKAIIFGATGQDGSHLADLLISKGYEVTAVSRRCSVDNTQRIKHLLDHERFHLVQGDITDASSVINILQDIENVDEVYNLAAQSHVGMRRKNKDIQACYLKTRGVEEELPHEAASHNFNETN